MTQPLGNSAKDERELIQLVKELTEAEITIRAFVGYAQDMGMGIHTIANREASR